MLKSQNYLEFYLGLGAAYNSWLEMDSQAANGARLGLPMGGFVSSEAHCGSGIEV